MLTAISVLLVGSRDCIPAPDVDADAVPSSAASCFDPLLGVLSSAVGKSVGFYMETALNTD
jgi:hypothetical protein